MHYFTVAEETNLPRMSLLKYTILAICLVCGHVSNAQCPTFHINYPPTRTVLCPGDNITYTCVLTSPVATSVTVWSGSGFTCPGNNPANAISLTQIGNSLNTMSGSCGNLSAVMTNISGSCYTSVLTIPTPQYFNGTTVTCNNSIASTLIGSDTLNIQLASPPSAPTITSLISTYSDQLTVTWTSVSTATSYNVSINDVNNTLVSIPSTGSTQYTWNFTNLTNNTVYNVTVVAINCAGSTLTSNSTAEAVMPPTSSSSTVPMTSRPSQTPTVATTTGTQPTTAGSEAAGVNIMVAMVLVLLMLV